MSRVADSDSTSFIRADEVSLQLRAGIRACDLHADSIARNDVGGTIDHASRGLDDSADGVIGRRSDQDTTNSVPQGIDAFRVCTNVVANDGVARALVHLDSIIFVTGYGISLCGIQAANIVVAG